jgi:hypothetical protein
MEDTAQQSNGMGTAAMVIGIIAVILAFIPLLGLISWILAPLAIIFGIIGMTRQNAPKGAAIAGVATGGVALVVCLLWALVFGAAMSTAAQEQAKLERERQQQMSNTY